MWPEQAATRRHRRRRRRGRCLCSPSTDRHERSFLRRLHATSAPSVRLARPPVFAVRRATAVPFVTARRRRGVEARAWGYRVAAAADDEACQNDADNCERPSSLADIIDRGCRRCGQMAGERSRRRRRLCECHRHHPAAAFTRTPAARRWNAFRARALATAAAAATVAVANIVATVVVERLAPPFGRTFLEASTTTMARASEQRRAGGERATARSQRRRASGDKRRRRRRAAATRSRRAVWR